jgi:hypothetical protein
MTTTVLNHNPAYGGTQHTATCKVTAGNGIANSDLDESPTGTTLLMTAPTGGAIVTKVSAMVVEPACTAAAMLALYLSKDAGTTKRMIRAVAHTAYTFATTTAPAQDDFGFTESAPLRLEAGDVLYAQMRYASAVTDAAHFKAEYTDLVPDGI